MYLTELKQGKAQVHVSSTHTCAMKVCTLQCECTLREINNSIENHTMWSTTLSWWLNQLLPYHTTGPLEIQFVSGATRHTVVQYSMTDQICLYPMHPCECIEPMDEISLMWVKNVPSSMIISFLLFPSEVCRCMVNSPHAHLNYICDILKYS